MRKVIVSEMVSLDGFYSRPNGEIDWHVVGEEFNAIALDQLNEMDALLFGRVTYQLMVSYWPTPVAIQNDPVIADKMNTLPKLVFSKTLASAGWGKWDNASVVKGDLGEAVARLKQQPGKDMAIFGSGAIVAALTGLGLVDEYRLFVVPAALGRGVPLFPAPVSLKLLRTRALDTGVVQLCYAPA